MAPTTESPKLRFHADDGTEFPSIQQGKLRDIATPVKRKAPSDSNAPIMMISAGNGFIYQRDRYSRDNAGTSLKNYTLLKRGELSYNHGYSKTRIYGSCFALKEEDEARIPYVYHSFAVKGHDPDYFGMYLNCGIFDKELKKLVSSTARMDGLLNISFDDYMSLPVNIPSLSEQQKIVDFLSAYDKKISLQKERVEKLEERKKGLLQKVFSQEIRFKADDGSEFPEWENKTIGDICDALTGFPFESKGFVKKGVRLLRGMNVKRGYIDFSDDITAFWKNTDELNPYILQENDFIIQMDGALVGKSFGLLKSNQTPALLVQRVTRLRSESPITTKYIFQYFSSGAFDSAMMLKQTNSAVPHISLNDIKRFSLPYPSEIEQRKIVIFLENIDTQISLEKEKLATMQEIKKGLLQQMFC